ncbi:MAG: FHA domain-containing protein [Saprospiraceae bacterium]|nr:FHA domain-containing protein [Saprospiraceae bacterium]
MVLNGEQPGRIYSIGNYSNLILIGRDNDEYYNDIDVKEEWSSYISRKQATIDVQGNMCYLRDGQWSDVENKWISSKNGTYINYIKIEENQFHKLVEEDIILIGNTTLKIINV